MKISERQLELDLGKVRKCRSANLRARRRAGWWFERIRAAMDSGVEPRPNMDDMDLASRDAKK